MKNIRIIVDTNDADYEESTNQITDKEIDLLMPLLQAIKEFKPYIGKSKSGFDFTHDHNSPYSGDPDSPDDGEYIPRKDLGEKDIFEIYSSIDKEIIELFLELCPDTEYGFHTVKSVEIIEYTKKDKLI